MKKLIIVLLAVCLSTGAFAEGKKKPRPKDLLLMIQTLQAQVVELQTQIDAIGPHSPDFSILLDGLYRDDSSGYDTLVFSGMNVQLVNGTGSTDGTSPDAEGTGNLVIGYNHLRDWGDNIRTGSHNLIIGDGNNYTTNSYGGMVVGYRNEIDGGYASVSGGAGNEASGLYSSISGGVGNEASGRGSSVSGGAGNEASGSYASVNGGRDNLSSGWASSVSGGFDNRTTWSYASVSGGENNLSSGWASTVSGGLGKIASSTNCTVGDNGVDC